MKSIVFAVLFFIVFFAYVLAAGGFDTPKEQSLFITMMILAASPVVRAGIKA